MPSPLKREVPAPDGRGRRPGDIRQRGVNRETAEPELQGEKSGQPFASAARAASGRPDERRQVPKTHLRQWKTPEGDWRMGPLRRDLQGGNRDIRSPN